MSEHQDLSNLFPSLEQLCLDVISDEFLKIAKTNNYERNNLFYLDNDQKFRFRNSRVFLSSSITTKLIERLGEMNLMESKILKLFSRENAQISHVNTILYKVNKDGLKIFQEHRITDLRIELLGDGKREIMSKLIDCLNKETLDGLQTLQVSNCKNVSILVNAIMIRNTLNVNLTNLNLSYSSLTQGNFRMICMHFLNLKYLNVSGTPIMDLREIIRLKDKLVYLSINDMPYLYAATAVYVLKQMDQLKTLNLTGYPTSAETAEHGFNNSTMIDLLLHERGILPKLEILDISGCEREIRPELLLKFIQSHPDIRILGLIIDSQYLDVAKFCLNHQKYLQDIKIACLINEDAILYALEFNEHRHNAIAKILEGVNQRMRANIMISDKLFAKIFSLLNSYEHNCVLIHQEYLQVKIMDYFTIYFSHYPKHLNNYRRNHFTRIMNFFMDIVETSPVYSALYFQDAVQYVAKNGLEYLNFDKMRFVKKQFELFDSRFDLKNINWNLSIISLAIDKLNLPIHKTEGGLNFIKQLTEWITKCLAIRLQNQYLHEIIDLKIIPKIPIIFNHYLDNCNQSLSNNEICEMLNSYLTGDIINDMNHKFIYMELFPILVFVLSLGKNSYFNQTRVFMDNLMLQVWTKENLDDSIFPIGCITAFIVLFELKHLLSLGHLDGSIRSFIHSHLHRTVDNWEEHGYYDDKNMFTNHYLDYIEIWCDVGLDDAIQSWALRTLRYLYTSKTITKVVPSSLFAKLLDLRCSSKIDPNVLSLVKQILLMEEIHPKKFWKSPKKWSTTFTDMLRQS